MQMGFKTKFEEPFFEHLSVSNAAVRDKEQSLILGAQVVQGLDSPLDFFLATPLT